MIDGLYEKHIEYLGLSNLLQICQHIEINAKCGITKSR